MTNIGTLQQTKWWFDLAIKFEFNLKKSFNSLYVSFPLPHSPQLTRPTFPLSLHLGGCWPILTNLYVSHLYKSMG